MDGHTGYNDTLHGTHTHILFWAEGECMRLQVILPLRFK